MTSTSPKIVPTSPKIAPTSPKIIHVGLPDAAYMVKSSLMTSTLKPNPTLFSQKQEASVLSTVSSKSNNDDEAASISALWSRMYPDNVLRPKVNPSDLKRLCPTFQSNPVLYKTYCSYYAYKKSLNQRALTLQAFESYYTDAGLDDSIPYYEACADSEHDFE